MSPATLEPMSERPIRVLDLFAGAGGLTAGFHQASDRYRTVRAVEMDLAAAASYEATFGTGLVYAGSVQDWLRDEDVPPVDVIVGGPPCQGFSTLGKQNAEDARNVLWQEYARTIVRAHPKYFVVENVAAFRRSPQYDEFERWTGPGGFLSEYAFQSAVLNAADYGAPQARRRTVIIGHLKSLPFPGFPEPTTADRPVTVRQAWRIEHVPLEPDGVALPAGKSTEFRGKRFPGPFVPRELHVDRHYTQKSLDRFAEIPAGGNRFDLARRRPDLLPPCWRKHTTGSADVMGRLHYDAPSVTIRTEFFKPEKGRYLHPDTTQNRAITHFEAAVLQGFPPTHRFVGSKVAIARQIGNAVPIPLAEAVARQLEEYL